jgi:hypothetical protein
LFAFHPGLDLRRADRALPLGHLLVDPARPLTVLRIAYGDRERTDPVDRHLDLISVL